MTSAHCKRNTQQRGGLLIIEDTSMLSQTPYFWDICISQIPLFWSSLSLKGPAIFLYCLHIDPMFLNPDCNVPNVASYMHISINKLLILMYDHLCNVHLHIYDCERLNGTNYFRKTPVLEIRLSIRVQFWSWRTYLKKHRRSVSFPLDKSLLIFIWACWTYLVYIHHQQSCL